MKMSRSRILDVVLQAAVTVMQLYLIAMLVAWLFDLTRADVIAKAGYYADHIYRFVSDPAAMLPLLIGAAPLIAVVVATRHEGPLVANLSRMLVAVVVALCLANLIFGIVPPLWLACLPLVMCALLALVLLDREQEAD